jgi:hypothetical protein
MAVSDENIEKFKHIYEDLYEEQISLAEARNGSAPYLAL